MDIHENLPIVSMSEQTGQRHLYAQRPYRAGECIHPIGARAVLDQPTYLTVQTGIDRHILLEPEWLQYCNHSCAPNVFFDTDAMEVVALADIAAGDELTFFYPSTEWAMAQSFDCYCDSDRCLGTIQGAAYLPEEVLGRYRFTEFIRTLLHQHVTSESL
jgi:hypothetical protein